VPDQVVSDYTITFDGGSRGNPGYGYGSYQIVRARDGKTRIRRLDFPGRRTNNEAEYLTLIQALQELADGIRKKGGDPRDCSVEVRGDSQLVIRQVEGKWKVREPHLLPLRDRARELLNQFGQTRLTWQRREKSVAVLGH
jgi:ribonuclease HI